MVNIVRVNHGRDFHPLADHMSFFHTFLFSLQLIFNQILSNLIICLMISQKNYIQMLQWILGRFDFSQNEFEMRLGATFPFTSVENCGQTARNKSKSL